MIMITFRLPLLYLKTNIRLCYAKKNSTVKTSTDTSIKNLKRSLMRFLISAMHSKSVIRTQNQIKSFSLLFLLQPHISKKEALSDK